jgi:uncharacterized membrane protein YoaK (UPF0700 family)
VSVTPNKTWIAPLLSFNGGFVDTVGFLGLHGLFTAHVTGNFVTLGAALTLGTQGVTSKLLALPEFVMVIALARMAETALAARHLSTLRVLLVVKALLLLAFFLLAATLGPFADGDAPAALLTGFTAVAAMAIQNAVQRIHFGNLPPTTAMTVSTTQATLDAIDLLKGLKGEQGLAARTRFYRLFGTIGCFAAGCGSAALLYVSIGFYGLAVSVAIGAAIAILGPEDHRKPSG